MKKHTLDILEGIAEKNVPNNFETIVKRIEAMPCLESDFVVIEKPKSNSRWKYSIAAACICAIISAGVLLSNTNPNNITLSPDAPQSTMGINNPLITNISKDNVIWNQDGIITQNRIAGEFKNIDESEWLKQFDINIPFSENVEYNFVYQIDKSNTVTDNIMFGYASINLTDNKKCAFYVFKSSLELSPVIMDYTILNKSTISGYSVYLVNEDTVTSWAAFEFDNYSIIIKMDNYTKDESVNMIKVLFISV